MIDFVRSFNPIWSLVDLNGVQFDDTFYMWVLENQIPYIPAPVYHTNGNPLGQSDSVFIEWNAADRNILGPYNSV